MFSQQLFLQLYFTRSILLNFQYQPHFKRSHFRNMSGELSEFCVSGYYQAIFNLLYEYAFEILRFANCRLTFSSYRGW